jgi:tetratricopeptide (TPR) repeat protein
MVREPIPDLKRKRLEKVFEVAKAKATAATKPGDFDYAASLLSQCVEVDIGNAGYVQAYLENLQKKHGNPKKISMLAQFQERGARSAVKKALAQEQWDDVIRHGLKVLAVNPWDVTALVAMARASGKSGDHGCELCYLMSALKGSPKDASLNRLYAIAMTERGLIDQAITFWHRVEEALPGNEEASRSIAALTVQKARSTGKFDEDDEYSRRSKAKSRQQEEFSFEQKTLRKIQENPKELSLYLELAQFYVNAERFGEAETMFAQAFELSDGDINIREKWEDSQLRNLRQKISKTKDSEAKKKLQAQYFEKDVAFHEGQVARYPGNLALKFELGCRYIKTKRYNDAIRELQAAKNDPRRKGLCMFALGECFRYIEQYQLAMDHYAMAIQEIPDRDAENKKKVFYIAGQLATALGDFDRAIKYLSTLASMDFTYKDVPQLLDKVTKLRENRDGSSATESDTLPG